MKNLRFLASLCVLVAPLALTAACSSSSDDDGTDSTITLKNGTQDTDIDTFKVTAVGDDSTFGSDLLDGDPLHPGDSITVGVVCGSYDLEITDDTGTVCTITDQNLCVSDNLYTVTDADLDACADGFARSRHVGSMSPLVHVTNR